MIQRKDPSKLGIQADHVKSDKRLENLKQSSSQNQDGTSRGTDRKKKMKKSRSIKLSNLEALQSPPSRRSLSQQGKPPPFHVPTTAPSSQKQKPLVRTIDGSLHYMKPTSSSDAKKEVFPVSLRNTQSGSDGKKASSVRSKKPAKTLKRSSSLVLMRTLTKTPSFKSSRACPIKSTTAVLCADVTAPERATCSSTLKDSNFPSYLMLNPEGASVMKVCSYKYCSLNCHHKAPLPPLKTFMPERRRLLKTQKSMKLETLIPHRLKAPCETRKDNDIEQIVFDGKPAYDEADVANPIITPLAQGNLEDQEEMKSAIEENGLAAEEDGVKQVTPSMTHVVPKSEIDLEEDFKNCFGDVTIEADTKGSFHQEQNAEDADENHQPGWFHEEECMGSYSSEVSYDGEHMETIELDVSDSQYTDMLWEEEQYCALGHEEDIDSSVFTEETDSKFESLLESSHDVCAMGLDEEESTCSETEPHGTNSVLEGTSESLETNDTGYSSNGITCDQSSSREEVFQHLANAEDDNRENEKHVGDEISCATKVIDEEMVEACEIDESREDSDSSLENSDESIIVVNDLQLLEGDQVKANKFESTSLIGDEKENTSKNWQWESRRKRLVQDDEEEEMRKIKPRKPNFLPLVPDPEPEKVNLKHQMMLLEGDQVKANKFESTSLIGDEKENTSKNWQRESRRKKLVQDFLPLVPDPEPEKVNLKHQMMLLEGDQVKANKFESTSLIGDEKENTSKNWQRESRRKKLVQDDDEEMRKINPRKPNFLPLVPDPEPEKVNLKHQMMDERKNADEWMLDFALRQAVTKLAPAGKRKVALLVEAFETVMSIPKCETHMRNNSPFAHVRPIQACS